MPKQHWPYSSRQESKPINCVGIGNCPRKVSLFRELNPIPVSCRSTSETTKSR